MGIWKQKASSGGGDFRVCPAGTHPATLVAILDIGTHAETFQGKTTDHRKVVLCFDVHPENEEPIVVIRDYTLSFNEKSALRGLVEKWRGTAFKEDEEFEIPTLLGKTCFVQITQKQSLNNRTYARLDGVMKAPKGAQVPKSEHKPVLWSVEDGQPFPELGYEAWLRGTELKELVKQAKEARPGNGNGQKQPAGASATADEEPF